MADRPRNKPYDMKAASAILEENGFSCSTILGEGEGVACATDLVDVVLRKDSVKVSSRTRPRFSAVIMDPKGMQETDNQLFIVENPKDKRETWLAIPWAEGISTR